MSRGGNIARISVDGNGLIQPKSLTNIPGSAFNDKIVVDYQSPQYNQVTAPSGTILQVVRNLYQNYNSISVNTTWQGVPWTQAEIVPKGANSTFKIEVRWFGEVDTAWDVAFAIGRNGTPFNLPNAEGARDQALAMPCQTYIADDNASTPELSYIMTYDTPPYTFTYLYGLNDYGFAYNLMVKSNAGRTLWTGRVMSTNTSTNYEQGSIETIVTEYAA